VVGSKLEKVRLLADYLQTLEGDRLAWVIAWFTGYPFPPSHNKTLQLGGAVIRDALCVLGGVSATGLRQIYLKHSDAGETAFEILSMNRAPSSHPSPPVGEKVPEGRLRGIRPDSWSQCMRNSEGSCHEPGTCLRFG